jgi:hypothetical protein
MTSMSKPDVLVYGIHPHRAPRDGRCERMARATYEAACCLYDAHPDLSFGFVDLRSQASWPAQQRLRAQLGRALRPSDAPILEIDGRLYAGFDPQEVDRALAGRVAGETGSWEGFLSSPGMTLEYMRRVDREIDTLNISMVTDAAWRTAPLDFRTGWVRFLQDWKSFYKRNEGFFSRTFADVYDDTKVYEQHVKEWRERWVKLGGRPSAPATPEADHNLSLPSLPSPEAVGGAALGLGALVAAVAGIYFASRFAR